MSILLGLLIGVPFTAALLWRTATSGSHSFWDLFAYAFGVLFIFNLVDLLILDWLIVCWFEPRWVILPGTEHIVIPKQYLHHFKGFLMGTVVSAIEGLLWPSALSVLKERRNPAMMPTTGQIVPGWSDIWRLSETRFG